KENKEEENSSQEESSKKKSIYLPSGTFVRGKLITGGDFPASDFVKANPYPVLIRLTDLAILPNDVKGNLKGCFIIAEGFGDLAAERAYIRPVYLSCLDWEGNAVIDQKIKGFVADSDGKLGLRGRVVSKMGNVLARVAMAGFLEGLGKGLSEVLKYKETYILPQGGVVQRPDEEGVVKAAGGEGISLAAKQLSQFYLALAQQTVPVVEVNAVRDVYVIVTEGTELEIKDVKKGIWNKDKGGVR
ncbi:MAG: TraB/VirB10 family protein, partial [Candidatus Omnitrophica bacterium]|nr:TraB/VirB10 family protein [Candidatus Omnitrophota bacterium]